jgi:hypothetical protein
MDVNKKQGHQSMKSGESLYPERLATEPVEDGEDGTWPWGRGHLEGGGSVGGSKASPEGWLNSFLYPLFQVPQPLGDSRRKLENKKNSGLFGDQRALREYRDILPQQSYPLPGPPLK